MSAETDVRPCGPCRHDGHGSCRTLITGAPCGCLCRLADQDCPDDPRSITEGGEAA